MYVICKQHVSEVWSIVSERYFWKGTYIYIYNPNPVLVPQLSINFFLARTLQKNKLQAYSTNVQCPSLRQTVEIYRWLTPLQSFTLGDIVKSTDVYKIIGELASYIFQVLCSLCLGPYKCAIQAWYRRKLCENVELIPV